MTTKKDGGPAFPRAASTDEHNEPCNVYQDQDGMTLRDWFAGQALTSWSEATWPTEYSDERIAARGWTPFQVVAADSYGIADAMLAERENVDD